jgi:hypothetical protein
MAARIWLSAAIAANFYIPPVVVAYARRIAARCRKACPGVRLWSVWIVGHESFALYQVETTWLK